uniref:Uncharacterized protein n=1 Tax=Rhizophora mucronata TaxID=61149 RepID=A0A2P2P5M4_RHIMU
MVLYIDGTIMYITYCLKLSSFLILYYGYNCYQ